PPPRPTRARCPYTTLFRSHRSPERTAAATEQQIVALRDAHPTWGARKLARRLARDGQTVPAISTVHTILRRYDRVSEPAGTPGRSEEHTSELQSRFDLVCR